MRQECARLGHTMYCSRSDFISRPAVTGTTALSVIYSHCQKDLRTLILSWLNHAGPFWDDDPLHYQDAWFVARNGEKVYLASQTGLAECYVFCMGGNRGVTASLAPSDFAYAPVNVEGEPDESGIPASRALENFWELDPFIAVLGAEQPLESWADLEENVQNKFARLCIADRAFEAIANQPFSRAVADEIGILLNVLDRLSGCVGEDGRLNKTGQELHQTYFTGHRPRFTDSTDREKLVFKDKMTFPNPHTGIREIFPWHGKVRMGVQYRIHFEWPKRDPSRPLPVVYFGPKLTKW